MYGDQRKMISNTTQRTSATTAQYLHKYRQIRDRIRCLDGLQKEAFVHPDRIVRYLIEGRSGWAKRTWIYYKRAVIVGLEEDARMAGGEQRDLLLSAASRLAKETQALARSRGARTSAKKAKTISIEEIRRIIMAMKDSEGSRKDLSEQLTLFMVASFFSGLRPSEWGQAELVEGSAGLQLKVVNAKATNGRSNGRFRHIHLDGFDNFEVLAVQRTIECARAAIEIPNGYHLWQQRLRNHLRRVAIKAFGKRVCYPSLYTFRHQFAANAKKAFTQEEVAALLGHGSTATAGRHYARARSANGTSMVRPDASEVRTVRTADNSHHPSRRGPASQRLHR